MLRKATVLLSCVQVMKPLAYATSGKYAFEMVVTAQTPINCHKQSY